MLQVVVVVMGSGGPLLPSAMVRVVTMVGLDVMWAWGRNRRGSLEILYLTIDSFTWVITLNDEKLQ